MTPKKAHYLLLTILIVTIIIIGAVLYFGRQKLAEASQKVINAKLEIVKADKVEETYIKNKQIYLDNEDVAGKLNVLVPNEKEQAEAVQSIYDYASKAKLKVGSIEFPSSNLDPLIKSKTKIDISQATPVKNINGVYEIPIDISIAGQGQNSIATSQLLTFIEAIESSPRNMRITSITYDSTSSTVKLSVSLYVKK